MFKEERQNSFDLFPIYPCNSFQEKKIQDRRKESTGKEGGKRIRSAGKGGLGRVKCKGKAGENRETMAGRRGGGRYLLFSLILPCSPIPTLFQQLFTPDTPFLAIGINDHANEAGTVAFQTLFLNAFPP